MNHTIKLLLIFTFVIGLYGCKAEDNEAAKLHFNQGFSYLGSLEVAASESQKEKLLDSAEKEFSLALEKNSLYFDAVLNRGAVYVAQGKFNKAEIDYIKAKEIKPSNPGLNYNLACLYSITSRLDLGLESLDIALANGFSDVNRLREDKDLNNLRSDKEFVTILEKHKFFLGD